MFAKTVIIHLVSPELSSPLILHKFSVEDCRKIHTVVYLKPCLSKAQTAFYILIGDITIYIFIFSWHHEHNMACSSVMTLQLVEQMTLYCYLFPTLYMCSLFLLSHSVSFFLLCILSFQIISNPVYNIPELVWILTFFSSVLASPSLVIF